MLKKEKPILLKNSASALCNNLHLLVNMDKNLIYYLVIHKSLVNFVTATIDGSNVNHRQIMCKQHNDTSAMMLQARIVQFSNQILLVTTSQRAIQIFDAGSCSLLHSHSLVDDVSKEGDTYGIFGRGICGVLDNYICVGTHDGQIIVFDVPPRGNIAIFSTLSAHDAAICDLRWEGMLMASSDDNGNICIWKVGGEFQRQIRIKGEGIACSSLALYKNIVIGGYASGHIRIFDVKTGDMRVEVAAHGRYITALDVAWKSGLLLSASEDSFMRVWQLTSGDNPQIEYLCGESVTDTQLQGANFLSPKGQAIALTGYDSNRIEFYTLS